MLTCGSCSPLSTRDDDNSTASAADSSSLSAPSLFNESTATLNFFMYSNDSHVIYHWPQINYTEVDTDLDSYNYVYELAGNSTGSFGDFGDDGDNSEDEDDSDDTSSLSKRATNCLNRRKRFKKTGCSGCGTSDGYKSGHNCKNAKNKGYSCLLGCKKHGHGVGCTESCGAVGGYIGYEHGVCWRSKCTSETRHDEL